MKYAIVSDLPATATLPGRLRLRLKRSITDAQAAGIERVLAAYCDLSEAKVSRGARSVIICYHAGFRSIALRAMDMINEKAIPEVRDGMSIGYGNELAVRMIWRIAAYFARRILLPVPVRTAITIFHSGRFLCRAAASLRRCRLDVAVLDGAAVGTAMLQRDFNTAASSMLLLGLLELFEEYTRRRMRGELSRSLVLNIDTVWVLRGETEVQITLEELRAGDLFVVGAGTRLPVDGTVTSGEAEVNQLSLTGEAVAVFKKTGDTVFAGTVVEEGSLVVRARTAVAESRVAQIIELIDHAESLKAALQSRAENMADKLVPFSFLAAGGAYLLTGNAQQATSVLHVDYSCAIKLSAPLAVLSAMREASANGAVVRGGKFLEAVARADTIVFDKTGTLTADCPRVRHVGAFGDFTRDEILRMAACIEEHYPHSSARAVIRRAVEKNLRHEEEHAEVRYVVAHGIATSYGKRRVMIGSRHFIEEDEQVSITPEQSAQIEQEAQGDSVLYFSVEDKLAGFLCITDPPRSEAAEVVATLRELGVRHIVMLTGDGENAARSLANRLGMDEYHAQLLPEQKQEFIIGLRAAGRSVLMVGDGINDSPALAEADVSVAMRTSSDIARETANITLLSGDLRGIVTLRQLSMKLMQRARGNFRVIAGFNSVLIALGFTGILAATPLALLHNFSTAAVCASSMRPLLADSKKRESMAV
ncbi:MAG: heavy metal translocating P-type ATPase [Peptococcaceae bacterium]|jgi:heavy metal translocating P-type ATPase|nr:heavy metal translocating P-type ATPase [Peptococcaceae bacterium]